MLGLIVQHRHPNYSADGLATMHLCLECIVSWLRPKVLRAYLPEKNCVFDWIWNMRPWTLAKGSALAPIGYAGVRHDNALEFSGQININHEILSVNGIAYL